MTMAAHKMAMQHVSGSSSVKAIGHHGDALHVTFTSGKTYVYPNVTAQQFDALRSAKSVGKHLNANIMPGRTATLLK
jgi:hypothetical protein